MMYTVLTSHTSLEEYTFYGFTILLYQVYFHSSEVEVIFNIDHVWTALLL